NGATAMRFNDALVYLENKMREVGFSRDREVFTMPLRDAWSCWLIISGNDYIMRSNLGLLNSEVSQLVHSSLLKTTDVDTRELRRSATNIPVYQLPLHAIDPSASKLLALNFHQDGVNEDDLDKLVDFIVRVGVPHLDEMMDLGRISVLLKSDFSSHLGLYLTPAILFLRGDKEGADRRMKAQESVLADN